MKVWVTRSEPGASQLEQRLTQAGVEVWCAPVTHIRPLKPWRCSVARPGLAPHLWPAGELPTHPPQLVIVLSRHAAEAYCASNEIQAVPHIAIGEKTQQALQPLGVELERPAVATSEGILQMPLLNAEVILPWRIQAPQVWILSGVGGRTLLPQHLVEQLSLKVCKIAVYERIKHKPAGLDAGTISTIAVASEQALRAVMEQWTQAGGDLRVRLVVASQRIAEQARSLGFTQVYDVSSAAAQSVADKIIELDQSNDG